MITPSGTELKKASFKKKQKQKTFLPCTAGNLQISLQR
jgi:hypothetical protein